jgi:hypothetical protein
VWSVEMQQVEPGQTNAYLTHLKQEWTPLMDAAVEDGVILSYKILVTPLARHDEWNVMLLVEVENMAALDGYTEKIDRIRDKIAQKLKGAGGGGGSCRDFRDVMGWRLAREVNLI